MRPTLGPQPLSKVVRFRLTDSDLEKLKVIADGASLSVTLRHLIEETYQRDTSE
jgi:hypothetical protein